MCWRCRRRPAISPCAKTNAPGPMSMSPVPYVSAFAKRRGNSGKSTARMAKQVPLVSAARKRVTALHVATNVLSLQTAVHAHTPFRAAWLLYICQVHQV